MKNLIIYIGWIILGFIQLGAMLSGLNDVLGKLFGFIVSLILGQIPIVGTILGIRGAIINWNWSVLQAIIIFVGAPIVMLIILGFERSKRDK